MNKNRSIILLLVLMMVAVVMGLYLVNQNQDTRRGAYFAGTKLLLEPASSAVNVGDDVPVQLWVDSGLVPGSSDKAKVDFVQARLCYGDKLSFDQAQASQLISVNQEAFAGIQLAEVADNCLDVAIASDKPLAELKSGLVRVATVRFKAVAVGSGTVSIIADRSQVSGSNPDMTSRDMALTVDQIDQMSYTVATVGGVTPTSTLTPTSPAAPTSTLTPTSPAGSVTLNFKMAFMGLRANGACNTNRTVSIVAKAGDVSKTYQDVPVTRIGEDNGRVIFSASKVLDGFTAKSGVAIFLKGPKHLQIKYGKNGQDSMYNSAGGELTFPADMYDFSKYPILAGDVSGLDGIQDGRINGLDFSLIKDKALRHVSVDAGQNLEADLDGDCMATNNDVQIIKTSLQEKQGQLY